MKKFVKFLSAILALVMLLALVACGESKPVESTAPESAAPESTSPEASITVEQGKLVMATNAEFPPYEYVDNGEVVGIDAEIAQAIAEKLGLVLEIENVDFNSIIPGVQTNKYDMGMAGMTVTDERKEQVSFSTTYATGKQVVIVKEDSDIKSVDDLFVEGANHVIGVQLATTGDLYCTWDIEDVGLGSIERYNKGAEAVMALNTGKVDCVVIDNEPAKVFVQNNTGLKILETEYIIEDYAIATNKDNAALLEAVDNALQELISDGTVQSILDKYITA